VKLVSDGKTLSINILFPFSAFISILLNVRSKIVIVSVLLLQKSIFVPVGVSAVIQNLSLE
jgi:hypothetical protein